MIVVGGGASGIAAAHYLRSCGRRPLLIEKEPVLGGRIAPGALGRRAVEFGGKNIGRRYAYFRGFAAQCGAPDYEYFGINSSQVRDGRIVTFDSRSRYRDMLQLAAGTRLVDAVRFGSWVARVRLDAVHGFHGSRYFETLARRYDAHPVSHYFGAEFCRRIVRPLSVRMNGAEPNEVYVGNLGTNIQLALDTFDQPRHGMQPLLNQFHARHAVRLATAVDSIAVEGGRVIGVQITHAGGGSDFLPCRHVVLASAATHAAELTAPFAPRLALLLREIRYFPVQVIVAEYARDVFRPELRALVFDDDVPLSNAGAYGANALNVVRYTFSGAAARPAIECRGSDEELLESAEALLARHLPGAATRRRQFVSRRIPLGLCAYGPRHAERLRRIELECAAVRGLSVTGDYVRGASIEACFRAARSCATAVAARLRDAASDADQDRAPGAAHATGEPSDLERADPAAVQALGRSSL